MTENKSDKSAPAKPKPKKNFTSVEEDKIIEYYGLHDHLWDPKHPDYKIDVKSLTIQTLVQELDNKFTASEIHHRFSGMRTTYRANANKVAATKTTGSDGTQVYVPTWPHFESMKFLDGTKPTRTSITSQSVTTNDGSEVHDIDETDMDIEPNIQLVNTPASSKSTPKHAWNKSSSSKGKRCNDDDVVDECLKVLRTVTKEDDVPTTKDPLDRCVAYGEFVTASLRDMTHWNQTLAMVDITNVLVKYDRNNPNAA